MSQQERIIASDFLLSVHQPEQLPSDGLLEIAFAGRSNAGKSSLLNALCNRRSLADTSKTPGRTQALNFFRIKLRTQQECYFVDLPGYGYAKVSKSKQRAWAQNLERYLETREQLAGLVLVCDIRREFGGEEQWFFDYCDKESLIVVLSKCDKLSNNEIAKRRNHLAHDAGLDGSRVIAASSMGKKRGIAEVMNSIEQCLTEDD